MLCVLVNIEYSAIISPSETRAAVAVFAAACRAADAFLAALFGFDHITGCKAHDQDDHPNGDPSFNSHSFFSLLTAEGVFLA